MSRFNVKKVVANFFRTRKTTATDLFRPLVKFYVFCFLSLVLSHRVTVTHRSEGDAQMLKGEAEGRASCLLLTFSFLFYDDVSIQELKKVIVRWQQIFYQSTRQKYFRDVKRKDT